MENLDVINQLYGSLKSKIPYADMKTVRKKVNMALGIKYSVDSKRFDKNLQKMQNKTI